MLQTSIYMLTEQKHIHTMVNMHDALIACRSLEQHHGPNAEEKYNPDSDTDCNLIFPGDQVLHWHLETLYRVVGGKFEQFQE